MQKRLCWLVLLFLAFGSWASAQQSSLVGTWVGKVQGFGVEMKLVLNADGSADYEGVLGKWRVQGNKLLLTEEGETVAYNFSLQGSQLTLSGGDLMAPMVLTRTGGAGTARAQMPTAPESEAEGSYEAPPPVEEAPPAKRRAASTQSLSEGELIELLEAGVSSKRLSQLVDEKGVSFAVTPAVASRLKAKGATDELIASLRGGGGAQPARPPACAAAQAAPGTRPGQPGGPAGGARGSRFNHEKWGLSFAVPPGWKVGERQGFLLMGSDTEAGLIIVRLARRTTLEQLVQEYGEGMQEEGLQLMPTVQAQEFPAGRNRAVAGELAGTAQDGAQIRARTIAVASPFGDAAVVLGMTTEGKYPGLKPRVESIASSFQFSPPQAAPILEEIAGQYYYISSSTYGSSERYIDMCSDGRFSSRSDTYSSGTAGTAYGEGGRSAQWTAEGDGTQGVIIVTNPDGSSERYPYQRSGSDLIVNGRTFARYGDGSCTKTSVY
jgi:hypothetical protein